MLAVASVAGLCICMLCMSVCAYVYNRMHVMKLWLITTNIRKNETKITTLKLQGSRQR